MMNPIGIIRRIDELGRVVIPKEFRRNMNIKEGDALEIFSTKEGVLFRKHRENTSSWHDACLEYLRNYGNNVTFVYHPETRTTIAKYWEENYGLRYRMVGRCVWDNDHDSFDPIIGQAIALCRAINGHKCNYQRIIGLEE